MDGINDDPDSSRGFLDMSDTYLGHWVQRNTNSSTTANHLATDADSRYYGITDSWNAEPTSGTPMVAEFSRGLSELETFAQGEPAKCKNTAQATSCIKIATNALTSMRSNSPSCLMGTHDRSSLPLPDAAVDSVLSAVQQASCAVRRVLGCPCRANPQLQLLLAVICAEIVASYRRVINTYGHHRRSTVDQGRGCDSLRDQAQQPESTSLLKRTPILIGNHHLEDSIESKLMGQVLDQKLQALEGLMGEVLQFVGQSEEMRGVKNGIESFLGVQLSKVKCGLAGLERDEGCIGGVAPSKGAST